MEGGGGRVHCDDTTESPRPLAKCAARIGKGSFALLPIKLGCEIDMLYFSHAVLRVGLRLNRHSNKVGRKCACVAGRGSNRSPVVALTKNPLGKAVI